MSRFVIFLYLTLVVRALAIDFPTAADTRLTVQLVASEPDILTPTGITVDSRGRIWAIENNTHFRPKVYKGAPTDRVLIFEDFAGDGKARKITVFAADLRDSMGIAFNNKEDAVFLATRNEIFEFRDANNDGVSDSKRSLIKLETTGNYPHNGLSGMALGPNGRLYFGLGENLGVPYKLIGADGKTLTGGGEGGNIYVCDTDGKNVERIATGFWNTFALAFDSAGRLFAVDNDPDGRPPCRLLHIIKDGDYGYRFRYGRKGQHPFLAWNGEIPGTLPMVSGTGEAPSGILAYQASMLPLEYRNDLLSTSWGDHVVQRFKLKEKGASFTATPDALIKGGMDFRPVGIATAPDGSLVISDWVSSSYEVHGKGRIWRVRSSPPVEIGEGINRPKVELAPLEDILRMKAKSDFPAALSALSNTDPFVFSTAVAALARIGDLDALFKESKIAAARVQLGVLLALRQIDSEASRKIVGEFLKDTDVDVCRAAIQWVGEEKLQEHKGAVNALASRPERRILEAVAATLSLLAGDKPDASQTSNEFFTKMYANTALPEPQRAAALRNLPIDSISYEKLHRSLNEAEPLRTETIRALALHPSPEAQTALRELVVDEKIDVELRADMLAGLSRSYDKPDTKKIFDDILNNDKFPVLRREARRSARLATAGKAEERGDAPSAAAGARTLYHPRGAQCFVCHRINGRGGSVGPDLSKIGSAMKPEKLRESILEPSKEIAPQFVLWALTLKDGKVVTGIILDEDYLGNVTVADAQGQTTKHKLGTIEKRVAQKASIMPDNLRETMTEGELEDLLEFLGGLK